MIMAAARCSRCALSYPTDFKRCPHCGKQLAASSEKPMEREEAFRIAKRTTFRLEYAKRNLGEHSKCGKAPQGPTPEELGLADAHDPQDRDRQILDLERTLRMAA